jgi:hypothetical protein
MVRSLPTWISKDPERAQGVLLSVFGEIPVDVKGNAKIGLDPIKIMGLSQPRDLVGSGGRI